MIRGIAFAIRFIEEVTNMLQGYYEDVTRIVRRKLQGRRKQNANGGGGKFAP